ncbi:hypothetical protein Hdeb2414_s0027g00689351 [Helianthus debilis subsp. tardiflorus]
MLAKNMKLRQCFLYKIWLFQSLFQLLYRCRMYDRLMGNGLSATSTFSHKKVSGLLC